MCSRGFVVAKFSDGIQIIPKIWLQNGDVCKYPSHYKTDQRIRKAVEREEVLNVNWTSHKIIRIFGEYCKYFNFYNINKQYNKRLNILFVRKNSAQTFKGILKSVLLYRQTCLIFQDTILLIALFDINILFHN